LIFFAIFFASASRKVMENTGERRAMTEIEAHGTVAGKSVSMECASGKSQTKWPTAGSGKAGGARRLWTEKLLKAGGCAGLGKSGTNLGNSISVAGLKKTNSAANLGSCGFGANASVKLASRLEAGTPLRILGVDPSLRGTGVAVVEFGANRVKLIDSMRINCPAGLTFFQCIGKIFSEIGQLLDEFSVGAAAIEQTVYVQNHRIAHILGAARGAIIAAIVNKNIGIAEYEPLRVKQAVTGMGRASKEQIRRTVCAIAGIPGDISLDESDAIAVAMCHAWTRMA
jgi:crossover junction endodeoxyribonuclease RuvC